MKFDNLKDAQQDYLNGIGDRPDNRQRINLSEYAYSIITQDMDVFRNAAGNSRNDGKRDEISRFINRIINNFKDVSVASSAQFMNIKERKYLDLLKDLPDREKAVHYLLEDYKKELKEKITSFLSRKGISVNTRLDQETTIEYLLSPEAQANATFYNDQRIGDYLKVMLEEYSEQPNVVRERIYYKDIIDTISAAVNERKLLNVSLHVFRKDIQGVKTRKNIYIKPYGLFENAGKNYNYIVGYASENLHGPWKAFPVRLNKVYQCKKLSYSGILTTKEQKELSKRIDTFGAAYTDSGINEKIIVRFTDKGEHLYRQIIHERPMYDKSEEGKLGHNTHCFKCTVFQARNYFSRFGKEATVLAPDHLVKELKKFYEDAAAQYCQ